MSAEFTVIDLGGEDPVADASAFVARAVAEWGLPARLVGVLTETGKDLVGRLMESTRVRYGRRRRHATLRIRRCAAGAVMVETWDARAPVRAGAHRIYRCERLRIGRTAAAPP